MKEEFTKEEIEQVTACLKDLPVHLGKILRESAEIIKKIFDENLELRDILATYQPSDYLSLDELATELLGNYYDAHFTNGDRIRLKHRPEILGTVGEHNVVWLMGGTANAYDVYFDHLQSENPLPIIASALESLPEADDPKQ
ncbi:hypothetical protein ACE3YX_003465 [Salmonella enterica]